MGSLGKNVCFLGIGGSGMAPLAALAIHRGFTVTGRDQNESPSLEILRSSGAKIEVGHSGSLPTECDVVVRSSAIKDNNPDLLVARKRNIPVLHRSEFLANQMAGHRVITVSGTHGKTTTTSLCQHMLRELGLDPTSIIGGKIVGDRDLFHAGHSPFFVAEADESDRSFLNYPTEFGILTNIDLDHLDEYSGIGDICSTFSQYLNQIDKDGWAIVGWDNEYARDTSDSISCNRLSYGFTIGSEIRAIDYQSRNGFTTFRAVVEKDLITCRLPLLGKHNVQNALAALALARALGLSASDSAQALSSFSGVHRRMEIVINSPKLIVIDDYAHNPGKLASCIAAAKESWVGWKIRVAFQPHRYSRIRTMYSDFCNAFCGVDELFILPVYSAGEIPHANFDFSKFIDDLQVAPGGYKIRCGSISDATEKIHKNLSPQTVMITLGAGDVSTICNSFR